MWAEYLSAIALLSFAYPLGFKVGTCAPDEVKAGGKYVFLLRDSLVLAALAVASFSHGQTLIQYALPLLIIISYIWFWNYYKKIYPFLLPVILAASMSSAETFVFNGALIFLAAFTQGITEYKKSKKIFFPRHYWPTPIIGAIITLIIMLI